MTRRWGGRTVAPDGGRFSFPEGVRRRRQAFSVRAMIASRSCARVFPALPVQHVLLQQGVEGIIAASTPQALTVRSASEGSASARELPADRSSRTDGPACRLIPCFLGDHRRDSLCRAHPATRFHCCGVVNTPSSAMRGYCSAHRPPRHHSPLRPGQTAWRLAQQSMSHVLVYTTGYDADSAR